MEDLASMSVFDKAVAEARAPRKQQRAERWDDLSSFSGFLKHVASVLIVLGAASEPAQGATDDTAKASENDDPDVTQGVLALEALGMTISGAKFLYDLYRTIRDKKVDQNELTQLAISAAGVTVAALSLAVSVASGGSPFLLAGSLLTIADIKLEEKALEEERVKQQEKLNNLAENHQDQRTDLTQLLLTRDRALAKLSSMSRWKDSPNVEMREIYARTESALNDAQALVNSCVQQFESSISKIMNKQRIIKKIEENQQHLKLRKYTAAGTAAGATAGFIPGVSPLGGIMTIGASMVAGLLLYLKPAFEGVVDMGKRKLAAKQDAAHEKANNLPEGSYRENRDRLHREKYVGLLKEDLLSSKQKEEIVKQVEKELKTELTAAWKELDALHKKSKTSPLSPEDLKRRKMLEKNKLGNSKGFSEELVKRSKEQLKQATDQEFKKTVEVLKRAKGVEAVNDKEITREQTSTIKRYSLPEKESPLISEVLNGHSSRRVEISGLSQSRSREDPSAGISATR